MTTDLEREIAGILIGSSTVMRQLRATILRFAPSRISVLIQGPTGSGKELVALALHRASGRTGAFVPFNVCAIGDSMFEDTLFGHVKGAFTGALTETRGYLREANGGTVLLDEISGLPTAVQVKLLRALETGIVRPVGGSVDFVSDFRVIAATNEDLDALSLADRFRPDLLHRIRGLVIRVPSLRSRLEDLPELVRHFLQKQSDRPIELSSGATDALRDYAWPGNVRELRGVVARLVLLASAARITRADVNAAIATDGGAGCVGMAHDERLVLLDLLASYGGDVDAVARHFGRHRTTIYRRLQRLGIEPPRSPGRLPLRETVESKADLRGLPSIV